MENSEIKILLTSDLHLGIENSEVTIPEKARLNTFRRIINLAREHDILLIAGDLIHDISVNREIMDIIRTEFISLRDNNIDILITPGPGELTSNKTIASWLFDLRASYIFTSPEAAVPYTYTKNGQQIYFYGIPSSYSQDIAKIKKTAETGFHIGLFHVEFDIENTGPKESVFKLHKKNLKKLELDFYALGHNHNFKMFKVADRIIGTYPGSPEAVSFNETGDRYVISISIKNDEIYHIKRLSVNSVKVCDSTVNCSDPESQNAIFKVLDEHKGKNVILRLTLTGFRDYSITEETINQYKELYMDIILHDRSIPTLNSLINQYATGSTIRGEFYKALQDDITRNAVPSQVDLATMAELLHLATEEGFERLEEWLCE
ncbi:MAG TPA: metallophosphoesterase [Spirochaetota bacterium]|nr:metallophosphoesterase [Spirochaetota bacterium]HPI87852.1 metallophosphoesterase [Spirochaetota bacterium]HPR47416.1 metallophosphoesterase [Spirochaetota bacterium]